MKNIYFIHIPKTAGRTITTIFNKYKYLKQKIYAGEKFLFNIVLKEHKHYYEYYIQDKYVKKFIKFNNKQWNIVFWHIPLSFWKQDLLLDLKKKNVLFTIIRNPYDRIVSDFKFWIKFYLLHKDTKFYFLLIKQIKEVYEMNFSLNKVNLNKVIQKLLLNKKYKYYLDGHLIHQHKFVYTVINNKLIKISDEILKFETLEKDFINFKKKYIPEIKNSDIQTTHVNPTQNKDLDIISLTTNTKNLIYKYYKLDFKIFGYEK